MDVIEKLANDEKLDEKYKDHPLKGKFYSTRECHIEPDFLLIYEKFNDVMVLSLLRLGTHSTKIRDTFWFIYLNHPAKGCFKLLIFVFSYKI